MAQRAPNVATIVSRELAEDFAAEILDDPAYRANLLLRAQQGRLHPTIEALLFFYRYGKPSDRDAKIRTDNLPTVDYTKFTTEELAQRARDLATVLDNEALRQPAPGVIDVPARITPPPLEHPVTGEVLEATAPLPSEEPARPAAPQVRQGLVLVKL